MRILAFESSARAASAAVLDDGRLLAEYFENSGQTHSRTLLQMAEDLLRGCGLTPRDIDAAAVAAGPGSFTGVRIGVAAAKGFAWGLALPCCGVSTLEAMAYFAAPLGGRIVPVMDARRNQVYTAVFRAADGVPRREIDDCAISLEELGRRLAGLPGPKHLVGDGAALCHQALCDTVPDLRLTPEHLRFQRAAGVALAAQARISAGENADGAALTPSYLRLSQAERERAAREQREERMQNG